MLEYEPDKNTTFCCVVTKNDSYVSATFKVNERMYLVDALPDGVTYVGESRSTGVNGDVLINRTLTVGAELNGSTIQCCFVNQPVVTCRESFLLIYYDEDGNYS